MAGSIWSTVWSVQSTRTPARTLPHVNEPVEIPVPRNFWVRANHGDVPAATAVAFQTALHITGVATIGLFGAWDSVAERAAGTTRQKESTALPRPALVSRYN
jgi:hypothetical protein